jgi:hypothetical protein
MNAHPTNTRHLQEYLDACPSVDVSEAEYRRLLGYPRNHVPGERARELAQRARHWYAEHGRPWVYLREGKLRMDSEKLSIDGMQFDSPRLLAHLQHSGSERVMLVAVSAGRACEEHARGLWQESMPDEYFFLEILGSAVVENLVAGLSARICDLAVRDGLKAVPHYSPGYKGWDVEDQNKLFELITRGISRPFPESLEVMASGMLRPKKSLLAVVGLSARAAFSPNRVPCIACSYSPCQYRRAPYLNAAIQAEPLPVPEPLTPAHHDQTL